LAFGPVRRIPFSRLDGGIDHNKNDQKIFVRKKVNKYNFFN